MRPGAWIHTDSVTFDRWARARSGLALPAELWSPEPRPGQPAEPRPAEPRPAEPRPAEPGPGEPGPGEPATEECGAEPPPVPPLVAASLAVHGWAEVAVTIRLTLPEGDRFGCFGSAGELAAGLIRSGPDVRIGLFDLGDLVDEVVRLVPALPPPPLEAATGCVRITVLGADAAVAGWQQILIGGESQWRRMQLGADPNRIVTVSDVHRELAADLRFVIADCLSGSDDHA